MDDSSTSRLNSHNDNNGTQRKPAGLLKSYHGVVYQIQWIMVVALQARKLHSDSGFTFRTEEDEKDVGKFDDVVWQYLDGLTKKYNFLQCKHKLNVNEKITMSELCKRYDQDYNPFSLQKYFMSYRDYIKTNPKYKDGIIANLVIATNVDFEDGVKNNFIYIRRDINPVLKIYKSIRGTQVNPRCLQIDSTSVSQLIISKLEETYDLIQLAKTLDESIRKQQPFSLPSNLKLYTKALRNDIIDPVENRLSDNFVEGHGLCRQAEFLREAYFQEAFVKQRPTQNESHDCILLQPAEFAKVFAHLIQSSENKNVVIHRKLMIVKNNIDKLAGIVLIKEDGVKFNHTFWTIQNNDLPNESFIIFRNILVQKLQEYFNILNTEDSEVTIANKLDAFRFKITNFVTVRKELVNELSFWNAARKYTGFENICSAVDPSEEERGLPDYSLSDIKENIQDFFNLLVFAVGYSRECLSQVVQYDLRVDFGYINTEYVAEAFRAEIGKCLDMVEDRYISTSGDVDFFFNTAKHQIYRFILIGPSLEYRNKLFSHNLKFSKKSTGKIKLRSFLRQSTAEQVLYVTAIHSKLSSIKVHQVLESIPEYQCKDQSLNYIFMCLSTICSLLDLVLQNFEYNCNLLVIECDTAMASEDEQFFYSEISKILTQKRHKKVVLISAKDHYFIRALKSNSSVKLNQVYDKQNSLLNLTKNSQDMVMCKSKVLFQGNEISLATLLEQDIQFLVNADVLYKVINGDKIEIGDATLGLGKVRDYYVNRTFCRSLAFGKEVLEENDIFAISNIGKFELHRIFNSLKNKVGLILRLREFHEDDLDKSNPIRYIILNNDLASSQFMTLCNMYQSFNIHWFNKENDFFIWKQTHGSLSNLHLHLRTHTSEQLENEFVAKQKHKTITIISAEPGMGKSTVTSKLETVLKHNPCLWIGRINLLHCSTDFEVSTIDESFAIQFIYKAAKLKCLTNKEDPNCVTNINENVSKVDGKLLFKSNANTLNTLEVLEIGIFNHCFNESRFYILLDGYDEICSAYEEKVLKLLNVLKASSLGHLFVTTRPYNILNSLEINLHEFAFTLKPFDNEEQKFFLTMYWKTNLNLTQLNANRANIFIDELLSTFSEATSDEDKKFVSIPLQLQMLADNFQDEFEEFYNSNVNNLNEAYQARIKDKLNLINLYDEFVNIKFEKIRFKEKKPGHNNDYNDMKGIISRERIKFIDDHYILSMHALFHTSSNKILSHEEAEAAAKLIQLVKEADDENGIVTGVVNNLPIFVHQTFAEYFAARYLWEKFKTIQLTEYKNDFLDQIILENIFNGQRLQICRFFYFSAEKDFVENVCIHDKDNKIVVLLEGLVDIIKSLYHMYYNRGSELKNGTDDIYQNGNTSRVSNIRYFNDANYVPSIKLLFKIIECYISQNEPQNKDIAEIIRKDETIDLLRISGETGAVNFAKYFVQAKQFDYEKDLQDKKWYFTPLWLAAKKQHLEVVLFLSTIYDCNWTDKDRQTLSQRIFNVNETNVLRSCLLTNIIHGSPYKDLNNYLKLPLVTALDNEYPADIVKMILEKSDANLINEFDGYNLPAAYEIITNLVKYDSEITTLVVMKGINFSGALNVIFFEFGQGVLENPLTMILSPSFKTCSFFTHKEFLNLNNVLETLLMCGVGFNSKDWYDKTTWQYSAQIYYVQMLLNYVIDVEQPLETLLKLMIDNLFSTKSKEFKYCVTKNNISIVSSNNNIDVDLWLMPNRLYQLHEKLYRESYGTLSTHLYNLRLYIDKANEEINFFKTYPDSKLYNRIFTGYEEMLEYCFAKEAHKTKLYKSLSKLEGKFLERVLVLYIRQDYDIKSAFKEVAAEVLKVKAISEWMKKQGSSNMTQNDELLLLLGIKDIATNDKLQQITSSIYDCGGIELLHRTWSNLYNAGQKNISEVLKSITKYLIVSTKNYMLFNSLNITYKKITIAIKDRNFVELTNILQNVDSRYLKSIINAQDDEYGSPLHYAVYKDDLELTEMLLSYGANPNCKLEIHCTSLPTSESLSVDIDDNEDSEDYKSYTSLHLAVIKSNIEMIKLLRSYNADQSIKNSNKKSCIQLAEERLLLDREKYTEIIDILYSELPHTVSLNAIDRKEDNINDTTVHSSDNKRKRNVQHMAHNESKIKKL